MTRCEHYEDALAQVQAEITVVTTRMEEGLLEWWCSIMLAAKAAPVGETHTHQIQIEGKEEMDRLYSILSDLLAYGKCEECA